MIPESDVTFAGSFLDRADRLRGDAAAQTRMRADPASAVLPFWQGKPLFDLTETGPRLAWLDADAPLVRHDEAPPVFMGLDAGGRAHFATDVSHIAPPDSAPAEFIDQRRLDLSESRTFIDLRAIMAEIDHRDAGIAAAAKGVFEWRRTHGFCANCGARVSVTHAGWRSDCPGCGRQHFPRTDPVVIMLVLDGDNVLLGRNGNWPPGMYSLLAGFVEPGETVEEAVRRETSEEAGIATAEVSYVTSQPWPFPASLMIGCVARAETRDIRIDPAELEDAIWLSRDDTARALAGMHPVIAPARKGAVAQVMMTAWVEGRIGLT